MSSSPGDTRRAIDAFLDAWRFVRGVLTREFIEAVPDEHWTCAPYPGAQALHKQFRHLVWCSGVYNQAFETRAADWSRKKTHYSGGLERTALMSALEEKDTALRIALDELRRVDLESWRVDFMGNVFGFERYAHVLIQHESLHHGMWSVYARLAGFETPASWKLNWDL